MPSQRIFTDLERIDLWESIRRSVTQRSSKTAGMMEERRNADWKTAAPRERATLAIVAMLSLEFDTPTKRRHVRDLLANFEAAGKLDSPVEVTSVREDPGPLYTDLSSTDQNTIAADLRFVMSAKFMDVLQQATGPVAALAAVEKKCNRLTGTKAAAFLAQLGYPMLVADMPRRRWLARYGFLDGFSKETKTARADALRIFSEWSHKTGASLGEMDVVLGVFTGALKVDDYDAAWCIAKPRCPTCPVRDTCVYAHYQMQHSQIGDRADARRNLSTAMLPEDRPREKLERAGAGALTNAELVAILLRTGSGKEHAVELASKILKAANNSLDRLSHMSVGELTKIDGLGRVKAITIRAALELARRASTEVEEDTPPITGSRQVYELLKNRFLNLRREQFLALLLNAKRKIARTIVISEGTLNQSLAHPREAFQEAIRDSAAAVIFVHNHPSGDPRPSRDDIVITHRLWKTGGIVGIPVLDHVIIGREGYYSFSESQTLKGDS